ncbi:MAG: hypothetical protein LAT83_08210, partial [Kiritimatiellae bacterium]|nr:hypothetical protein [Kiritimatiellia bacterium]
MKSQFKIPVLFCLFFGLYTASLALAGLEGEEYDLFLYHGKAQKDYWTGGSKDHGRTNPYVWIGTAGIAEIADGME